MDKEFQSYFAKMSEDHQDNILHGIESDICRGYKKIVDQEPIGVTDALRVLSNPELAETVILYLKLRQTAK